MLDLASLELDRYHGRRLAVDAYNRDFAERDAGIRGRHSWKFERRQHFEEHSHPSGEALRRGDWEEALRLIEGKRDRWLKIAQEDEERGSVFHRVRVVEEPPTPYLQWELHALRMQAEAGMRVRVVSAGTLRSLERPRQLPEVVTLGGQTMYQVVYTESGALEGAVRFSDPELVESWERFIADLFEGGEDVVSYVDRYVARLPPPRMGTE